MLAAAHALSLRLEELLQVVSLGEPRRVACALAVFEIRSVVGRAEYLTHDSRDRADPRNPASTARGGWRCGGYRLGRVGGGRVPSGAGWGGGVSLPPHTRFRRTVPPASPRVCSGSAPPTTPTA